jgi:hypothetical protein
MILVLAQSIEHGKSQQKGKLEMNQVLLLALLAIAVRSAGQGATR